MLEALRQADAQTNQLAQDGAQSSEEAQQRIAASLTALQASQEQTLDIAGQLSQLLQAMSGSLAMPPAISSDALRALQQQDQALAELAARLRDQAMPR
jgi:hypothetical protein